MATQVPSPKTSESYVTARTPPSVKRSGKTPPSPIVTTPATTPKPLANRANKQPKSAPTKGFEVNAKLIPAHGTLECTANPTVHKHTVNINWKDKSYKYTLTKDFGKSVLTPEEQRDFEEATRIAANYAIALAEQASFRPGATVGLEYVDDGVTLYIPKGDKLPSQMTESEQNTQECYKVNDSNARNFSTIIRTETMLAERLKPYLKKSEAVPAAPKAAKPPATASTQPAALENRQSYLCYLNSAFQLFAFPKTIRDRLLKDDAIIDTPAGKEFKRLLKEYEGGKSLSLETLRKKLKFKSNKTDNATDARDALIALISPATQKELFSRYHSSLDTDATLPTYLHISQGQSLADVLERFDTAPAVFMPATRRSNDHGEKDNTPIAHPLEFRLPRKACGRGDLEVEYHTLSGFVWHTGHDHYISYLRDGDRYWECNDIDIKEITINDFLTKAETGELHLYLKKDQIGSIQYPNTTIRVTSGHIVQHSAPRIVNFRKTEQKRVGQTTTTTLDQGNPIDAATGISADQVYEAFKKMPTSIWDGSRGFVIMNNTKSNQQIVQAMRTSDFFEVADILANAEKDKVGSIAFSIPERHDEKECQRQYRTILNLIESYATNYKNKKVSLKSIEIVLTEQQKAWIFPETVSKMTPPVTLVTEPLSSHSQEADDEDSGSEATSPVAPRKAAADAASNSGTDEPSSSAASSSASEASSSGVREDTV